MMYLVVELDRKNFFLWIEIMFSFYPVAYYGYDIDMLAVMLCLTWYYLFGGALCIRLVILIGLNGSPQYMGILKVVDWVHAYSTVFYSVAAV